MSTRKYEFNNGVETSVAPDASDPSADADTISLGYLNDRSYWGAAVADYNALTALDTTERRDNQIRQVDTTPSELWKFDSASTATDDGSTILEPDDAPVSGRWLILASGGGSGSSGGSGIETLGQKLDNEHYDISTSPLQSSLGSGFNFSKTPVQLVLLEDYASGTSMSWAINPLYVNDSDKNFDATTNWTAQGAGASLTTSGTKKIGTASLSFDKNNSATNARIRYDYGSAIKQINGYTEFFFWINLPSITNLSNIEVRVDVDLTNFQTFTATTSHTGAALTTGWQLMKFDLSTGGSASGTGWDKSKLFRYLHIGVNTSSAAQTYTAILVDSAVFSVYLPSQLVQVGNTYSIYDSSNASDLILSSASARVVGTVTIAAGLANAYAGGTTSTLKRFTMTVAGDDGARMLNGLSGTAADLQSVRLQRILPESLSSKMFALNSAVNTNMFFEVSSVTDSDTIVVIDSADSSANLVSGTVFHIFKVYYDADGGKHYENRNIDQTISSSSFSGGLTTINTSTTNTGVVAGDIIIVKHLTTKISLEAVASNENFQTPTLDSILVDNLGIPYPGTTSVWGHWNLSGPQGNKLIYGKSGVDLNLNGTLASTQNQFLNGQYATTGWTDSNYYDISISNSEPVSANLSDVTSIAVSFWFKDTVGFTGTNRYVINRWQSATDDGWAMFLQSGANGIQAIVELAPDSVLTYTTGVWNHVLLILQSTVSNGNYFYLNAVKSATWTETITDALTPLRIGRANDTGLSAGSGVQIADLVIWRNYIVNQSEVESLYNRGLHRVLTSSPGIQYNYSITGLSGQRLALENKLSRTTDAATPFITRTGCILT